MKKITALLFLLGFFILAQAQGDPNTGNQVATGLRANDKIWVVMAVCLTILAGLILYVVSLDRKISKLEKKD